MPQVFQTPKDLVDEFKKSGEFDRLRRQLLTHFANSDEVRPLMTRVEEIAKEKLSSDARLEHKTREAVNSEVVQELERYPFIERAVSEVAVLKDPALVTSIEEYLRNILQGESNDATKLWNAQPSRSKTGDENDDSSDYSEDDTGGDDIKPLTAGSTSNAKTIKSRHKELLLNDKDNDAMDVDEESKPSDKPGVAEKNPMLTFDKSSLEPGTRPNFLLSSAPVNKRLDDIPGPSNKYSKSPQRRRPHGKSPRYASPSNSKEGSQPSRSLTRSPTPRVP